MITGDQALSFAHDIGVDVWLRDKYNMSPLDQTPRSMAKVREYLIALDDHESKTDLGFPAVPQTTDLLAQLELTWAKSLKER